MTRGRDLRLLIFITSMSGSKRLRFFFYHFFHFRRPSDLGLTFDVAERNGKFGSIGCQRSKEGSSRGKRKRRVFVCRSTVRVKVKGQVISTSFLNCTNQQPPQRGGAVPDPVWVGSKWLLDFPRVPVTPGTPLHFFVVLPPERPQ